MEEGGGRGHSRKGKQCQEREFGSVGFVPGLCSGQVQDAYKGITGVELNR